MSSLENIERLKSEKILNSCLGYLLIASEKSGEVIDEKADWYKLHSDNKDTISHILPVPIKRISMMTIVFILIQIDLLMRIILKRPKDKDYTQRYCRAFSCVTCLSLATYCKVNISLEFNVTYTERIVLHFNRRRDRGGCLFLRTLALQDINIDISLNFRTIWGSPLSLRWNITFYIGNLQYIGKARRDEVVYRILQQYWSP